MIFKSGFARDNQRALFPLRAEKRVALRPPCRIRSGRRFRLDCGATLRVGGAPLRAFGRGHNGAASLATLLAAKTEGQRIAEPSKAEAMKKQHMAMMNGPKLEIAMLVFPGFYLPDLINPLAVFEGLMNTNVHLVWKSLAPVQTGSPSRQNLILITPNCLFKDYPDKLDVLFVPGGSPGTAAAMEDAELLGFLAEKGKTARFVTSVCIGSLVLGAAGLLDGYKATSHWNTFDILPLFGAIPTRGRVVADRNRITGGVTAGLDFGLTIAARLRDEDYAKGTQLILEYNPEPPFDAGSPETAGAKLTALMNEMLAPSNKAMREAAVRRQKRLKAKI